MRTLQKFGLLFTLTVLSGVPASAQSIHAGSASGSYTNDFCPQVQATLKTQYFEHTCVTSQGTGDNVEKVLSNPVDVGLGQLDIVAAQALEHPDKLTIVNPKLGLECLYAVTTDQSVTSLTRLAARMPVALPPQKSGSTATFEYLQSLDAGLAKLRKVTYHQSALEAVQAVIKGEAALAFFVQFPNTENTVFETINDAGLKFIPVINREILRREVVGLSVYEPQEVVVTPAGLLGKLTGKEPTKIDTTCTPMVLFTGSPNQLPEGSTEREDQDEVIKLLGKVQRPDNKTWKDTFANAIAIGKDKVESLIEKYSH